MSVDKSVVIAIPVEASRVVVLPAKSIQIARDLRGTPHEAFQIQPRQNSRKFPEVLSSRFGTHSACSFLFEFGFRNKVGRIQDSPSTYLEYQLIDVV